MAKPITLSDIMHPLGVGSAAISIKYQQQAFAQLYFTNIGPGIKAPLVVKDGEDYILLVRVPSQKNKNSLKPIYYDVLYQFYPKSSTDKAEFSIANYGVRIFSNSPSFVYAFAYVYYKRGIIPTFLNNSFLNKEAITSAPKIKNPGSHLLGLEKSIWMATFYLQRNRYFSKQILDTIAKQQDLKIENLTALILSQDAKKDERIAMKLKMKKKKKKGPISNEDEGSISDIETDKLRNSMRSDKIAVNSMKNGPQLKIDLKEASNAKNNLRNTTSNSMRVKESSLKAKALGSKKKS